MIYVVDASVAVKWFLPEADSGTARALLGKPGDELIAPDFVSVELANVFWRRARQGNIDVQQATRSLQLLNRLHIEMIPTSYLIFPAFNLAVQYTITVYDALYIALSVERRCALVTADRRLFNAVNRELPQVRLLSDM